MLSATQIAMYLRDPDEWRAAYLHRRRVPPTLGQVIGGDVHRLLAAYLRGDADISPPGPPTTWRGNTWHPHAIAAPGLCYLPEPGSVAVEVRRAFYLSGHPIVVIKDAEGTAFVLDHKITDDLNVWAMSPKQLAGNTQAIVSAVETLQREDCATVALRWVYYDAQGRGAVAVDMTLDRLVVAASLEPIIAACNAMCSERYPGEWSQGYLFPPDHCGII